MYDGPHRDTGIMVAPSTREGGETNPERPPHHTESDLQLPPPTMLPTGAQSIASTGQHQAESVKTRSGRVIRKPARYAEPGF